MEGLQTIKRKRVYSFEPNVILRGDFSHKYIHYLLPTLIKIGKDRTRSKNENEEIKKIVRFEVDMALVLSANGFAWSHALKHKLERDVAKSLLQNPTLPPTSLSLLFAYKHNNHALSPLPPLTRPLVQVGSKRNHRFEDSDRLKMSVSRHRSNKRTRISGYEEEIGCRLMKLRRILPGGDEMKASELFSEVESYVVCLELQVSILRTLVDKH